MKASVTWTVLALFSAVLGAYIYLKPMEEKPVNFNTTKVLTTSEEQKVKLIQIQNLEKKETITLEQKDGIWMLSFPVTGRADQQMTEGLRIALQLSARARRMMPEKDWAEYGLLKPKLKVGIEMTGETQRRYLDFGDPSPIGPFIFARWEDEKEYFLVESELKKSFIRSIYSLREKRVFTTPVNDISKISVRTPEGEYEWQYLNGKWFWLEPIAKLGKPIAPKAAEDMLKEIYSLYAKDFTDEKEDRPDLGFLSTGPSIKISGKKEAEFIKIGNTLPDKNSYYAFRKQGGVFFMSQDRLDQFFKDVEAIASE